MNNSFTQFLRTNHVLALIETALSNKSVNLKLTGFDIEDLPLKVFECHELKRLYLQHNKLKLIPEDIIHLVNLKTLAIDYNYFAEFPLNLCNIRNLVELNISHNPIKVIIPQINMLVNLEALWCNNCELSEVPNEICELKHLDTFGLRNNAITSLPTNIRKLKRLRWLTLENNKISHLPSTFKHLKSLAHLNLSENELSQIPVEITYLQSLKYCSFKKNHITVLDTNILSQLNFVYKIDLDNNPLSTLEELPLYGNLAHATHTVEVNWEHSDTDSDDSGVDWENSLYSSEIDTTSTDSESDENIVLQLLPQMSKFLL